jgi:uncharacterized membrane protein required for colicin V production
LLTGFTWVDGVLILLVLVFAIRGILRGAVAQVFVLAGLFLGLWATAWVSRWVGEHWNGARPTAVFWALRWLVAALAGVAVLALLQWWGEKLGETMRKGPLGALDRLLGVVIGGAIGVVVAALLTLAFLRLPDVLYVADPFAHAKVTPWLMSGGSRACHAIERGVPGSQWLRKQLDLAAARTHRAHKSRTSSSRA